MKVLVTGGGGFLGLRLARALLARGELCGRAITRLVLLDAAFPVEPPQDARVEVRKGDLSDAPVPADTAAIFHLAAVVSGAAEADFDLGMRVNVDGTRALLERARRCARPPRLVFSSSVAAFGGPLPDTLDDATAPTPQTSYGAQKVIGEHLVGEYARKGYVDGRALRLPTIVVRAGKPNAAASSFASSIIREPLNGELAECPVSAQTGMWLLSPGRAIEAFVHACELPEDAWRGRRVVNLPGISATVAEMLEALQRVAGAEAAARVRWKPDARIQAIVETWPARFVTPRALALGFRADDDLDSVIRDYLAERRR